MYLRWDLYVLSFQSGSKPVLNIYYKPRRGETEKTKVLLRQETKKSDLSDTQIIVSNRWDVPCLTPHKSLTFDTLSFE